MSSLGYMGIESMEKYCNNESLIHGHVISMRCHIINVNMNEFNLLIHQTFRSNFTR